MRSRRQFLYLSVATLLAVAAERALRRRPAGLPPAAPTPAQPSAKPLGAEQPQVITPAIVPAPVWLPLAWGGPQPIAVTPILSPAPAPSQIYLPIAHSDLDADDPPILGRPSGAAQQAIDWLAPR